MDGVVGRVGPHQDLEQGGGFLELAGVEEGDGIDQAGLDLEGFLALGGRGAYRAEDQGAGGRGRHQCLSHTFHPVTKIVQNQRNLLTFVKRFGKILEERCNISRTGSI